MQSCSVRHPPHQSPPGSCSVPHPLDQSPPCFKRTPTQLQLRLAPATLHPSPLNPTCCLYRNDSLNVVKRDGGAGGGREKWSVRVKTGKEESPSV
ncbi:hypothetical protein E2C01_003096 [Portunus trituberculatus]|uniref:Uncharacterized protein n=1 Tax=Portunus trituberculatus TaxID=210409 RepID=A0A5B7CM06_PORTR|nr:hypothetical protein [Portunus trituberculatus]